MLSKFLIRSWALAFLLPLLLSCGGFAQDKPVSLDSPAGRWKTVDDATGKAKSIVAIREENGKLYGTVEQVLDTDVAGPNPLCIQCEGDLKNRPVVGLQILWGLAKNGDEWSGGQILDPENGKVYRCYLSLEDGGKRLKLRGYLGFSLLGRTQHWVRVE